MDDILMMLPGPTNVAPRVLRAMSQTVVNHRGAKFGEIYTETTEMMSQMFKTENQSYLLTGSGTSAMEAAIANTVNPKEKIINATGGKFGDRLKDITTIHGINSVEIPVEWGDVLDPKILTETLDANEDTKAVTVIHNETSTGVHNPLKEIGKVMKNYDALLIVDTVSSLGGDYVDVDKYGIDVNYVPTREGLDELQASGSAQFSLNQFSALTKALQENGAKDIYIVDLRQENHGFFNNDAVSWYGKRDWANIGKSRKEIIRQEMNLLKANLNKNTKRATLDDDKNADEVDTSLIKTVTTEKNLVKKNNLHYMRITATDHVWPSPENIDEFIKLYKSLPKDAWLHFHCEAGKGRTTTFLAMYDMMKNPQVPLKDILYRQLLLGGNYVAYTEDISASSNWKAPYYNQKAKMIEVFYQYVQENHQNNFQVLWSDWLKNHSL